MANDITLTVEVRERTGKGGAREARRSGLIPGVLYGGDRGPVAITLNRKEVTMALRSGKFIAHTVSISHKGEKQLVFAQDIQFHPVSDEPLHLDLYRVDENQEIKVNVPVHFTGEAVSPGIKRGGALNIVRHEVELLCPANAIPEELVFDVSNLDIGDTIKISAIQLPPNARPTITDRDFTVATITGRGAKAEAEDATGDGTEAAAADADAAKK
ncbi:MAG: 50S ribosomal protein L25/general stress protein Ctc [Hyphomonadaceae bacterium]